MAKQLILCEKPSVAMDFAKGLGNFAREDGYLENDRYIITWAYGHLCELKMPEDYDEKFKEWKLEHLPIFPEKFEYRVIKEGAEQFKVIKKLIHRQDVSSVVVATDCGREGELIARLILLLTGNKKPVYRFWTSEALTPEVVQREIRNLKPAKEFDRLYQSALARQWADWLVGINATRAVTIKNGGELFSVGRVQTAVLSLIAEREKEIQNFKPQKFYNVVVNFEKDGEVYKAIYIAKQSNDKVEDKTEEENDETGQEINSKYAILSKEVAEQVAHSIRGKAGKIVSVESKISIEKPPLLFSLTTLQQEANKKFGFSAGLTLDIAQSLYEKHLISYPRTESQHLDPAYASEVKKIISFLASNDVIEFNPSKCRVSPQNKRIFDLSKLTDHHALVPQRASFIPELSDKERKIYTLICKRFIAAFYPDCKYKNTTIITNCGEYSFESKGKILIDAGWREIYGLSGQDILLPDTLKENDRVNVKSSQSVEKQTQPPPRYTDASLLNIMTNAHKVVQNPELRKILKENAGIGTPATRSQILEILLKRGYVYKKNRHFFPTDKGMFLIEALKGEKITSVEYTAVWEQALEDIARGKVASISPFLNSIKEYVNNFIDKVKHFNKMWQLQKPFVEKQNRKRRVRIKAWNR